MPPQITPEQFWFKMAWIAGAAVFVILYFVIRGITGGSRFLSSGRYDEARQIESGEIKLIDLQNGPWQFNGNVSATLSSFGLGTVILAIVFLFEQRLTDYDALFFNMILGVFGISILAYFLALQMWFLALDVGGSIQSRLRYRWWATTFQAVGWLFMLLAILLAAMLVSTELGALFSFVAAVSIIFTYEFKARISLDDETAAAGLNDFQKGIGIDEIFIKNKTQEVKDEFVGDSLKILSWNIERGYHPEAIIRYIKAENPDIVCLQEVDWNNARTGQLDVLEMIAEQTGMRGYFAVEFYEIQTPHRTARLAGGGVHGNAILTRIKPTACYRVELPLCFDWESPPPSYKKLARIEKRQGRRFALCADFEINDQKWTICSAHLEDKGGGVAGRFTQFRHLVSEIKSRNSPAAVKLICGDLNTLDNWIARLGRFTNRNQALGKPWRVSECRWWKEELLPASGYSDPFSCRDWTFKKGVIYRQKLDWILIQNGHVKNQGSGGFNTSDHRPLWIEVGLNPGPNQPSEKEGVHPQRGK